MKFFKTLVLLAILLAAVAAWLLLTPYGPSGETFVDIPTNSNTPAIATQLEHAGILRTRYAFDLIRLLKPGTLHPGEYRFDRSATPLDVYARIRHGDIYTRTLTIPEGYNIFDIAQAVQNAGLGSRDTFLAAEKQHTELIADLAPHATSLEGFLFPATYHLSPHSTPVQMLTVITRRFRQAATQLGLSPEGEGKPDIDKTVIMASLIEKEVSQDIERPLVAGVFLNRLAKDMPLQTDPAVVYAALLDNRYRGTIYRSDLDSPSPYNTYKHTGLPPGPIANPGMAAFRAALHPASTDYLYFVSDANGHTLFSATLAEHQEKVAAYRAAVHP